MIAAKGTFYGAGAHKELAAHFTNPHLVTGGWGGDLGWSAE